MRRGGERTVSEGKRGAGRRWWQCSYLASAAQGPVDSGLSVGCASRFMFLGRAQSASEEHSRPLVGELRFRNTRVAHRHKRVHEREYRAHTTREGANVVISNDI